MQRLLLVIAVIAGCRPSGQQNTPARGATSSAQPSTTASDSVRADSLLQRADRARIQGDSSAPVWIVELSDFQCPYCKQWHDETYPVIVRDYVAKGQVRLAYVNFPLQMHVHALAAAEAAMCAAAQNRFWPMHDSLFASQPRWSDKSDSAAAAMFDSLAMKVGVDSKQWRDCVRSGVMRRIVNADRARGTSAGVHSTPSFFVGDEPIQGAAPTATFRAAIERARAKAASRGSSSSTAPPSSPPSAAPSPPPT